MKLGSLRRLAAVGTIAVAGITAFAQTPAPQPTLIPPAAPDYGTRPVAYIYGTVPVTRAELAEFLIARGGYEKVELVVNKKIIDMEAEKRGIKVTTVEMENALNEDLKGISVSRDQFIEVVLAKYGKSYFEWMEDVVRPRLLLTAMCKQDVKVTDADLQAEFDRMYGEKRRIQIIIWPLKDDLKSIMRVWESIRSIPDATPAEAQARQKEFDRVATQQANPALGSTAGYVSPIGRNLTAEEKVVEEKAFSLKPGDVSEIFQTSQGYMVMKLHGIIPADTTKKLADVKETIYKSVYDLKTSQEIPKFFEKLKKEAKPNVLMTGPPAMWNFQKSTKELTRDALTPPAAAPVAPASGTAPPKP